MSNKPRSTFDKEMQDPQFKAEFEREYAKLLLSELIIALMDKEEKSVRQLAKEVGISPTVIQNIRSGKQKDIKMSNFINISLACGYHLTLEKGRHRIPIS